MTEAKSHSDRAGSMSRSLSCRKMRLLSRMGLGVALGIVAWCSTAGNGAAAAPALAPSSALVEDSVATILRPEVRLRKLHLVRPDLIMYPLSYDIYC